MHLLAATPGGFSDEEGITYIEQSPGDIVVLSAQDTDLSLLSVVYERQMSSAYTLRLANLSYLKQPASMDMYHEQILKHAKVVVAVLLGGRGYWQYQVEQLELLARNSDTKIILLPGDDQADEALFTASSVERTVCHRLWRCLREGGARNAESFIQQLFCLIDGASWQGEEPRALPRTQVYHPSVEAASLDSWRNEWGASQPVAVLLFYRVHMQSLNTQAIDQFIAVLQAAGLNPLPIATASLKDPSCMAVIDQLCLEADAHVILNTTGFAVSGGSDTVADHRHFAADVPVLQVIMAGNSEEDWAENSQGLRPSDIAMNIALPELDGRIITRAVSFKTFTKRSDQTECDVVQYRLESGRATFVAELALRWARLAQRTNSEKRIALVLANYPTKDGRLGNGVGLDTPQSVINILRAMAERDFPIDAIPADGTALVQQLLQGVTNDLAMMDTKPAFQSISLEQYNRYFNQLPVACQQAVLNRWGPAEQDPKARQGRIMIPGIRSGMTFIGIQPARGYNIDVSACYHDPDLVPPHYYLAFYFWIRHQYQADLVAHIGKHGNMEWLPGKGVALSEQCWPEVALGPMPHLYPFIVNDPGEGAQAKRRAQGVIIDHLMPPMMRAETYGPLQALELLVDEYYQAMGLDQRRADHLKQAILDHAKAHHLDQELRVESSDEEALLSGLDAYLCELKESQIRNGLHILGESPQGESRADTLVALTRLPRGEGFAGLLHALCKDFGLAEGWDPLQHDASASWDDLRPTLLQSLDDAPWRSEGDTRERLELFAQQVVTGDVPLDDFPQTAQAMTFVQQHVIPALDISGQNELDNFVAGLEGRFVPAGPSGAPTRGRLDTLPTGRNFFSVDTRAIPSQAAWHLGRQSAEALVLRHLQEEGDYPRTLGLSVWGTATMRTGGDDIAQAMALLGVRPRWAASSARVVGFEVIPVSLLDRPRVDVTLRISGFFRDAFLSVVQLFDAAVQAVAEMDEPDDLNPIRARVQQEATHLIDRGVDAEEARQRAGRRVFGSKPGAYGAGLQGLIDERVWDTPEDLAEAYVNWGGYAYGGRDQGTAAHHDFKHRLGQLEVVLQNQDNREHDILDSDDYYQFQGGMSNAVSVATGKTPTVYHADHSNPAAPKIRTLQEELQRVVRSRVVNPKWIESIKQHGYKGAFEMAATVDYLFAYDATTGLVEGYQYEMVTDQYLLDAENRAFLEQHNPDAMREMSERLLEAVQRGLWRDDTGRAEQLENLLLDMDQQFEGGAEG